MTDHRTSILQVIEPSSRHRDHDPSPSPACAAMRAMEDDLRQLAAKANVDDAMLEYLQARRTVTVGLLANIAKDYTELDTILFTPLEAGFEANGKTHKVEAADIPIAKASLRYLWKLCCDHISAPHPQLTPPAGATTPGTGTPNVPSGSGAKAQKELSADTMRDLLKYYEDEKVHGVRRVFPQKMLLGAEKIIARVRHEIQQKAYTPMALQEILCARYYDAAGNVNPLAQAEHKNASRVVLDVSSQSVHVSEDQQWTPKGVLSLLDAIDAIGWCWVLTQLAHEVHIDTYLTWWRQLVRAKANKIEQLKSFWADASWRMCLEMRQGQSFEEMSREIMSDSSALQTALNREPPAAPKNKPKPQASSAPRGNQPYQKTQIAQGDYKRHNQEHRRNSYGNKRWQSGQDSWQPSQYRRQDGPESAKGSQSWRSSQPSSHAAG